MPTTMQKWARAGYLASGFALVAGIYLQAFLATHAVSVAYGAWSSHVAVGRGLLVVVVLMWLFSALGKLPSAIKRWTAATVGLYLLQYTLITVPPLMNLQGLTALHGMGALALYTVAHKVVIDAVRFVRGRAPATEEANA